MIRSAMNGWSIPYLSVFLLWMKWICWKEGVEANQTCVPYRLEWHEEKIKIIILIKSKIRTKFNTCNDITSDNDIICWKNEETPKEINRVNEPVFWGYGQRCIESYRVHLSETFSFAVCKSSNDHMVQYFNVKCSKCGAMNESIHCNNGHIRYQRYMSPCLKNSSQISSLHRWLSCHGRHGLHMSEHFSVIWVNNQFWRPFNNYREKCYMWFLYAIVCFSLHFKYF